MSKTPELYSCLFDLSKNWTPSNLYLGHISSSWIFLHRLSCCFALTFPELIWFSVNKFKLNSIDTFEHLTGVIKKVLNYSKIILTRMSEEAEQSIKRRRRIIGHLVTCAISGYPRLLENESLYIGPLKYITILQVLWYIGILDQHFPGPNFWPRTSKMLTKSAITKSNETCLTS